MKVSVVAGPSPPPSLSGRPAFRKLLVFHSDNAFLKLLERSLGDWSRKNSREVLQLQGNASEMLDVCQRFIKLEGENKYGRAQANTRNTLKHTPTKNQITLGFAVLLMNQTSTNAGLPHPTSHLNPHLFHSRALMSTGLNLVAADTVLLCTPCSDPATEIQIRGSCLVVLMMHSTSSI
jgi:hypothetical protein